MKANRALAWGFVFGISACNSLPIDHGVQVETQVKSGSLNMYPANTHRSGEGYPTVDLRAGLDFLTYDVELGRKIQTTPTHPSDSSKPTETTAPLGSYTADGLRAGVDTSFGDDEMRLKLGADLRYTACRKGQAVELLEERQQDTDSGTRSFAFTRLKPDKLTYTLLVGAERSVYGIARVGVEAGFPYTGFEVESGRDRLGEWEVVKKDSWSGFGKRLGLTLDVERSERVWWPLRGLAVFVGTETFEPKLDGETGEVKATFVSLVYKYRF